MATEFESFVESYKRKSWLHWALISCMLTIDYDGLYDKWQWMSLRRIWVIDGAVEP